ncbi:hypothetical protein GCM10023215_23730 [Pseudonocardia yuanmonensis]|uniref:DUF3152 domain-containing protein n=1 Tax=Pseudonocardia yuanmonensis TaxID=1095914 RepID=A0ABP8WEE2_9PSEU
MPSPQAAPPPAGRRARTGRVLAGLCLPLCLLLACARPGVNQLAPDPADRTPTPSAAPPPASAPPPSAALAAQSSPLPSAPSSTPSPTPSPTPTLPPEDVLAGLTRREVPPDGAGALAVVPGSTPAPGPGPVRALSVAVEAGLPVDAEEFASFVMTTLNDPRGWGAGGAMSFARTDGEAAIHLVLATPGTTNRLCAPLDTAGEVSCRNQEMVVLNFRRWVEATPEYTGNPTGYRQYLVNHEVGHALGHGHEACPGPGRPAPVMQQQTLGLHGCTQNSWPHP